MVRLVPEKKRKKAELLNPINEKHTSGREASVLLSIPRYVPCTLFVYRYTRIKYIHLNLKVSVAFISNFSRDI